MGSISGWLITVVLLMVKATTVHKYQLAPIKLRGGCDDIMTAARDMCTNLPQRAIKFTWTPKSATSGMGWLYIHLGKSSCCPAVVDVHLSGHEGNGYHQAGPTCAFKTPEIKNIWRIENKPIWINSHWSNSVNNTHSLKMQFMSLHWKKAYFLPKCVLIWMNHKS